MSVLSRIGEVLRDSSQKSDTALDMPNGVFPCFGCLVRKCDDRSVMCRQGSSEHQCSVCEEADDTCEAIPQELRGVATWYWNRLSELHLHDTEGISPDDGPDLDSDTVFYLKDPLKQTASAWRTMREYLGSLTIDGIEPSEPMSLRHSQEMSSFLQIFTLVIQFHYRLISQDTDELRRKLDSAQPAYRRPETLALSLKYALESFGEEWTKWD